jgi:ABC-2 type transport system ATP-binding protein
MSVVVENVTKLYGEQKVLDDVSFEVKTGEIVGFLGPNGAGKSTMIKIITGFIPASSGRVFINGIEIGSDNTEIKKHIGYLPENNPLYPEMYVREYLGYAASFYTPGKSAKSDIEKIIELTGLAPEQKKKIGSLSKGYRQRVGLAQALIHNPDVLILDEATSGLDPNQITEIRNLIREAGREKTVMLSTHIMQEVEAICDRVIIINKGVIVANEEKELIYARIRNPRQVVEVEFDRNISESYFAAIDKDLIYRRLKDNVWIIEAEGGEDIRPVLFSFAVNNKLTVLSMQQRENNLEDIFRLLTS